jgi:ADP-ribosyl-[dinitrogen reductase] hydrolase
VAIVYFQPKGLSHAPIPKGLPNEAKGRTRERLTLVRGRAAAPAERQSVTTHGAAEAVAGCTLLARVLCRAIGGDGWGAIFVDDDRWPPLIRAVGQGVSINRSEAEISSSGYVVHTLEAAYWACKRSANFEEAILTAANLGNDADTVAAVAGQIAGAVWGFSAIPPRWVERLHDSQRIQDLAAALYDAGELTSVIT